MKIKFFFTSVVICCLSLFFASCSDDDTSIEPLTEDSIKGTFTGTLTVGQGEEAPITIAFGDKMETALPVDSIVKLTVPQEYYEEAMTSAPEAVLLEADYSVSIFGLNLSFTPVLQPLSFSVTYGGVEHEIAATLYNEKRGNYNGSDYSLSLELLLDKITLDGEEVAVKESLPFVYDMVKN